MVQIANSKKFIEDFEQKKYSPQLGMDLDQIKWSEEWEMLYPIAAEGVRTQKLYPIIEKGICEQKAIVIDVTGSYHPPSTYISLEELEDYGHLSRVVAKPGDNHWGLNNIIDGIESQHYIMRITKKGKNDENFGKYAQDIADKLNTSIKLRIHGFPTEKPGYDTVAEYIAGPVEGE